MASFVALTPILRSTPVTNAASVVTILQQIEQALATSAGTVLDGVAWFNRLYARVTESVIQATAAQRFQYPEYIETLDVAFANYYFSALQAFNEPSERAPRAWAPLLTGRERTDVAPIQFAVAGMNAHINRDLPVALAELWRSEPAALPSRDAQQRDYRRMNELLATVETEVKAWFLQGKWRDIEHAFHGADDVIATFSIAEAREAAWAQAEALVMLGGPTTRVGAAYLEALDGTVGALGRGLLVATRR